jgi:hypothetical protein
MCTYATREQHGCFAVLDIKVDKQKLADTHLIETHYFIIKEWAIFRVGSSKKGGRKKSMQIVITELDKRHSPVCPYFPYYIVLSFETPAEMMFDAPL